MHGNLLRPLLELIEKEEEAKDEKIKNKKKTKKQNKQGARYPLSVKSFPPRAFGRKLPMLI